jgi:ubiquinone/menaquinone biosynthesis C-methylase UbiE
MESIGYVSQCQAFCEAHRVLKMGGKAIVKDFAAVRDTTGANIESWSYDTVSAGKMVVLAEAAGLKLVKAFALHGTGKRFERFCNDSKLIQSLHPIGVSGKATQPFWFEFVKMN